MISRISAPGGEKIAYASVGDGPILVLAAWWTSHLEMDWNDPGLRLFIETLAQNHTVVRYDRPGVGLSERIERPYDLDAETEYLNSVVGAVSSGDEPVDVLGISCGGPASVRFAVEHPERVCSLVLFASYVRGTDISDEATRRAVSDLVRANWGLGSQALTNILLPGAEPSSARRFSRSQQDTATADVAADLLDLTFKLDASPYVADVEVPTLVLHRVHDRVIGCQLGRDLADRIPGADYQELEGKAHVPWTADCSLALERMEGFLTGEKVAVPPRRRLATVCFIDIVESTTVLSDIGDARWGERLDHLHQVFVDEATGRGGDVLKDTGDGALLTFDLPGDAVDFCQVIRRRAAGMDLEVRCGLHMGEIEIREDDITGLAVVIASRVADAAAGNQILATRTIADLVVGSGVQFDDCGSRDLKGVAGEWALVDVAPIGRTTAAESVGKTGYQFGEYELDLAAFELRCSGQPVQIEPQVFEVLTYLVEHRGELVTKEQLLDDVWGDRFVAESSLSSRIRSARVAVGDDGQRQAIIKTVHGRGFRFVAEVD